MITLYNYYLEMAVKILTGTGNCCKNLIVDKILLYLLRDNKTKMKKMKCNYNSIVKSCFNKL